jgi:UDP-glucose 4-epimerase
MFDQKVLMITGGTGSFGKTVLKRFLSTNVSEIRIFSRDEKKQEEMRLKFDNDKLKFYIGDVRDYSSVYHAMKGGELRFSCRSPKTSALL